MANFVVTTLQDQTSDGGTLADETADGGSLSLSASPSRSWLRSPAARCS